MGAVVAWRLFINKSNSSADREFEMESMHLVDMVNDKIASLPLELLAFQSLFRASDAVSRTEFKTMFDEFTVKAAIPGLLDVMFAQFVPEAQLAPFQAGVRADASIQAGGYPDFKMFPPGTSGDHLIINYVQPSATASLMGFDLFSDPVWRPLLEQARDEATIVTSRQLQVVNSPNGIIVAAPVYRKNAAIGTVDERRAAFVGIVYLAFETQPFLAGLLATDFTKKYDLELYDVSAGNQLLFDSSPSVLDNGNMSGRHRDVELSIGGRKYHLHLHLIEQSLTVRADMVTGNIVLGIGALLSLLGAIVVYVLVSTRTRAERLAASMTTDIVKSRERYLELLEALPDPTLLLDKFGRIQSINRAGEEASGYKRSEIIGKFFPKSGLVAPSSLPRALRNFTISVNGRLHPPYEIEIIRKDGSRRSFEVNARPVRENGKTTGVQVLLRDVTKRREIGTQLERQAAELQRINRFMIGRELKMKELKREVERMRGTAPS